MQTLTVQITHQTGLKILHTLEEKKIIRIIEDADLDSPVLPGSPLPLKAFKQWITDAGSNDTISLKEARKKWAGKRKQLQKLTPVVLSLYHHKRSGYKNTRPNNPHFFVWK